MSLVAHTNYKSTGIDDLFLSHNVNIGGFTMTEKKFKRLNSLEFALLTTASPLVKGAVVGAIGGATVGAIIGTCVAGPVGTLPGAGKGAVVGTLVGFIGGCIYIIARKNEYEIWKVNYSNTDILKAYEQVHLDNELLECFMCPIGLCSINTPVRDPYGNLYDKENYIHWIKESKKKTGIATDPKRNGPVKISDLKVDYHEMARMQAAYKKVLLKETIRNIHPEVKKGLEKAAEEFGKKVTNYYDNRCVELLQDLRAEKISKREYSQIIAKMTDELDL